MSASVTPACNKSLRRVEEERTVQAEEEDDDWWWGMEEEEDAAPVVVVVVLLLLLLLPRVWCRCFRRSFDDAAACKSRNLRRCWCCPWASTVL